MQMFIPDYPVFASNLTSSEKLVLLAIKFHISRNKTCYVGQQCLGNETSLSRGTVNHVVQSLITKGWIKITERKAATHVYRLVEEKFVIANSKNKKVVKLANNQNVTSSASSTPIVQLSDNVKYNEHTVDCTTQLHKVNNTKSIEPSKKQQSKSCAANAAHDFSTDSSHLIGEDKNPITNVTPSYLEKVWREKVPIHHDSIKHIPIFTGKEYKILKDFISRVEPYNPCDVLTIIIEKWSGFCDDAKTKSTAFNLPTTPSLEFISKYSSLAANFYLNETKYKEDLLKGFVHK